MQQPELTSSFLLPRSVWLQQCQGWAFLIVFKITMSPFDDANVGNRGRINHRAPSSCSAIQKGKHCAMLKHTHTHAWILFFFYLYLFFYIIFSPFSFCLTLTHVIFPHTHAHTNPQLFPSHPLHDGSKKLEFIPCENPPPPGLSFPIFRACTHTPTYTHTHTHTTSKHALCGFCQYEPQWKWSCRNVLHF